MTPFAHDASAQQDTPSTQRAQALPLRLLIAEDAQCVRMVLLSLLRKMHIRADTVENGQLACDKAEQSMTEGRPYDLILMDMQMPQMNGYKAVEWLRQQGWQGPIVAVSALAGEKDHQKIIGAGCDDFVAKPVTEAKLRDVFERHLTPKNEVPPGTIVETPPALQEAGVLVDG